MRTVMLTVSLAAALAASPVSADPLGEILSLARRIGYVDDDYRYGSSREFYYYGDDGRSYAGRRGNGQYVRTSPGASATDELLHMDDRLLRSVARAASADFDRWLSGIPAGEVWRKHFESREIQEALASDVDALLTPAEREVTERILGIFDQAVANADLNEITSVPSARTLHAALRELATHPDQRLLRQLSMSARNLNRSLAAVNTGVSWQRYLALPDGVIAAADRPPGDAEPPQELDPLELGEILERYDNVARSPEYQAIASIPEFQATHRRLTEMVNPPPDAPPPVPTAVAEELPPPELETR
jgi:hypothetical protein